MKKIVLLAALLLSVIAVRAQKQEKDPMPRIFVWDIPQTEKMYTTVIPDTMRVVAMYDATGHPLYALTTVSVYNRIIEFFKVPNVSNVPLGLEFVSAYIEDFSLLSRKNIKMLSADNQVTAKIFNKKVKYLVLSTAPNGVVGKWEGNRILPDRSRTIMHQIVNSDPDPNSQQQNNGQPAGTQPKSSGRFSKKQ